MKKTGKILFLTIVFCIVQFFGAGGFYVQAEKSLTQTADYGEPHPPRLVDEAQLLNAAQEQNLMESLDQISEKWQCDIVIVAVNSLNGADITNYADDYFDYQGYGLGDERSGILFLLSMNEREWAVSTRGFAITAFTDAGQEYITDRLVSRLSDGEYEEAFSIFAQEADDFLKQAGEGKPYDRGNLPGELARKAGIAAVVGLIGGFFLALLRVAYMKKEMKPVYAQTAAENYLVRNSLCMQEQHERLIRRHVNRTHIPENHSGSGGGSSVHRSSSGASHGGSHGKF